MKQKVDRIGKKTAYVLADLFQNDKKSGKRCVINYDPLNLKKKHVTQKKLFCNMLLSFRQFDKIKRAQDSPLRLITSV
ncbi:hypothetical protein RCO48_15595 [Peribacillus frigoritolerans]|nr:hypothetical protein [Peribacillus frigoritolerans]